MNVAKQAKSVSEMSPQELAEACAVAMWKNDSTSKRLGMALETVGPGHASLTMTITADMLNGHGNCHGGYIFTLADSAFAFACNAYNQLVVGQHCSISYIAPGRAGDVLTAHATEVSRRGRSGIYDIRVTNDRGEHVAEFRGHSRAVNGTLLPTGA